MRQNTDTLIDFIKNFKENDEGYSVGQIAAQQIYPFAMPSKEPLEQNVRDKERSLRNGYLGAGFARAVDILAPFIISFLQQNKETELSDNKAADDFIINEAGKHRKSPRGIFIAGRKSLRSQLSAKDKEKDELLKEMADAIEATFSYNMTKADNAIVKYNAFVKSNFDTLTIKQ